MMRSRCFQGDNSNCSSHDSAATYRPVSLCRINEPPSRQLFLCTIPQTSTFVFHASWSKTPLLRLTPEKFLSTPFLFRRCPPFSCTAGGHCRPLVLRLVRPTQSACLRINGRRSRVAHARAYARAHTRTRSRGVFS